MKLLLIANSFTPLKTMNDLRLRILLEDFLHDLQEAAGVDILGETTVNNISYHASFQKAGLSGLLNFPAFYQVHSSFCQYHLGGDLGNYHLQQGSKGAFELFVGMFCF